MRNILKEIFSKNAFIVLFYTICIVISLFLFISVRNYKNIPNILPNIFGPKDYIVNGKFNDGLNGWDYSKAEIKYFLGENCLYIKGVNNKSINVLQSINVISGKTYRLTFNFTGPIKGGIASYREYHNKYFKQFWCKDVNNSNKMYECYFVPKMSGKNSICFSAAKEGDYYFSNVSLKLISTKVGIVFEYFSLIIFIIVLLLPLFLIFKKVFHINHYFIGLLVIFLPLIFKIDILIISILILSVLFYLSSKFKWVSVFCLILSFTYAILKRFLYLGKDNFWLDEFLTEERVWWSSSKIFEHAMTSRCIIYSFILKIYGSIISFFTHNAFLTEFQLRLPHAIIGTLALFVLYLIGKRLKSRVCGLILVMFASFSPFLIHYAREARYYPFILFYSVILIYLVFKIVYRDQNTNAKKIILYYLLYSIVSVFGMHTHQSFWLLFGASNLFLFFSEFLTLLFTSNKNRYSYFLFITILLFLTLPIFSAIPCIYNLLNNGFKSDIIIREKLVPHLTPLFFSEVHKELWPGLAFNYRIQFLVILAFLIMLFSRKTRKAALYLITITVFTFISLRNMGKFNEPFRVKYISFIWVVESIALVLSFSTLMEFLLGFIKNNNISIVCYSVLLSLFFFLFQIDIRKFYNLPSKDYEKTFFRSVSEYILNNYHKDDLVLSYYDGYAALSYYNRVFSSNLHLLNLDYYKNFPSGYVFGGKIFSLIKNNDFTGYNSNITTQIFIKSNRYSLFESKIILDELLQDNIRFYLYDSFKNFKKIKFDLKKDRFFYTANLLNNGFLTNSLSGWKSNPKDCDFSLSQKLINGYNYLVVSNYSTKQLIISQDIKLNEGGMYSFCYNTMGFNKGGLIKISSKGVNRIITAGNLRYCLFPKYANFNIGTNQIVSIQINIMPNDVANLSNLGLYLLKNQ